MSVEALFSAAPLPGFLEVGVSEGQRRVQLRRKVRGGGHCGGGGSSMGRGVRGSVCARTGGGSSLSRVSLGGSVCARVGGGGSGGVGVQLVARRRGFLRLRFVRRRHTVAAAGILPRLFHWRSHAGQLDIAPLGLLQALLRTGSPRHTMQVRERRREGRERRREGGEEYWERREEREER